MKKALLTILTIVLVATPILTAVTPRVAEASCGLGIIGEANLSDCVFAVTAEISKLGVTVGGALLTITGTLLNATLVATLNMKTLVDNTPSIGVAWKTIRDFSSIFIIFLLLYASIMMILGVKTQNYNLGKLIVNIVIAGLLINFSLFMTKFIIDTSNLVSLSFYTAMVPPGSVGATGSATTGEIVTSAYDAGGLSNVFMQSLDIQKVFGSTDALKGSDINYRITLANVGATVLMIVAAFSFLFAAIAFAVRIGILILLMAFSPIYFIAMILPEAKEYSEKWKKTLFSMCLFMPVYLFLMYVAVSIINDPRFFDFARPKATSGAGDVIGAGTVGIVLQYLIAFIMINAPLLAAIKIGGEGSKLAVEWGENAKKWGQGFVGQHTVGRAAKNISESAAFGDFARRNPNLAAIVDKNILQKGAAAAYGGAKGTSYNKRFKDFSEAQVKAAEKAQFNNPTTLAGRFFNRRIGGAAGEAAVTASYQNETNTLEQRLNARKTIMENMQKNGSIMSEGGKKKLAEETAKLQKEVDYRKKVIATGGMAKEQAAQNLESGFNPATKAARKDAAKKIRKNISKDKTEKLLEQLANELKPQDKPKDEGAKPKEEGGGAKK